MAKAVAGPPRLPAGSSVQPRPVDMNAAVGSILSMQLQALATGAAKPKPWPLPPEWQGSPFGPGDPLISAPINLPRPDTGRPEPRFREYQVGENLQLTDHIRYVPWDTLYKASQQPLFRKCIDRRKSVCELGYSVGVTDDAIASKAMADGTGKADVEVELRRHFQDEISRVSRVYEEPDPENGFDWPAWGGLMFENHLVYDAVAIYPRVTNGGQWLSFEITDGHLWKPLTDEYGRRPRQPYPAYQQIVWGFPRGDFMASVARDADGGTVYQGEAVPASELLYERRTIRPGTQYGLPPTETALIDGLLWTRRFQWMLAEYTEGVQPDSFLVNKGEVDWTPQQVIDYERFLNDRFGGNTASRMKWPMLPPGIEPVQSVGIGEKYRPDYDLFIIKLVAGDFGVPITELGFTETGALGATFHEGNEDVMYRQVRIPDARWLGRIATKLARRYLAMPPELEVKVLGLESEDEAAADAVAQNQVASGRMTMNEDRTRVGKPPYPFREADMPMLQTQRGVIFIEDASLAGPAGTLIEPPHVDLVPGGGADPNRPDTDGVSAKKAGNATTTPKMIAKSAADTAAEVYDRMLPDYPPKAIGWIHGMPWHGPVDLPLSEIDTAGMKTWDASHEPERVAAIGAKIAAGDVKPGVVVKVPGHDKVRIVDGHHHYLAARKLGVPYHAYVGVTDSDEGPWDETHSYQYGKDHPGADSSASDEPNALKSLPVTATPEQRKSAGYGEAMRLRKFLAKRADPPRPFRCEVLTRDLAAFICPELVGSAHVLFKDADAGPKVPRRHWPGWDHDEALAAAYSPKIAAAVKASADWHRLAEAWLALNPGLAKAERDPRAIELIVTGAANAIAAKIAAVLRDLWREGWRLGRRSAAEVLGDAVLAGDADDELLDVFITEAEQLAGTIAATRAGRLAVVLEDALRGDGQDAAQLAAALEAEAGGTPPADLTAATELARAQVAAAVQSYLDAGIGYGQWLTAEDARVCAPCAADEAAGPVPIGDRFPSGLQWPPGHPLCRCAYLPRVMVAA